MKQNRPRRRFPAAAASIGAYWLFSLPSVLSFAHSPWTLSPAPALSSTVASSTARYRHRRTRRSGHPLGHPLRRRRNGPVTNPGPLPTAQSSFAIAALPSSLPAARNIATSRESALLAAFAALVAFVLPLLRRALRPVFWPKLYDSADPSLLPSNPLPPIADPQCPYLGNFFSAMGGTKDYGAGAWYRSVSAKMGHPSVLGTYLFGRPRALISGGKLIKVTFGREFEKGGPVSLLGKIGASGKRLRSLIPPKSVLCEPDRARHAFMRRLVGAALTPRQVGRAAPALRSAAEASVDRLMEQSKGGTQSVEMEGVCKAFTLDVARRQILGLDLTEEEAPAFAENVDTWIHGLFSLRTASGIGLERDPAYRAREYLKAKIEEKIDSLEANGPDASTLSGMVFATDDEVEGEEGAAERGRKLTREEVVDNALVLILAGSETSASTLTNAALLLGLHPNAWERLVDEQRVMMAKRGDDDLTREALDSDCPYIDAVVKETMRIRPLSTGAPRIATSASAIDGVQIPEGWAMAFNIAATHDLDPKVRLPDGSHMDVRRGFRPERWLDDLTRPSDDFVPLGAGPRYCLGANLAYAEMKVFLAVLARRIDLRLARGKDYDEGGLEWKKKSIIPLPADGVPVLAKARVLAAVPI